MHKEKNQNGNSTNFESILLKTQKKIRTINVPQRKKILQHTKRKEAQLYLKPTKRKTLILNPRRNPNLVSEIERLKTPKTIQTKAF